MRDAFCKRLLERARLDESLILLLGDVGALVLNDYRRQLPQRCLNMGVAEENMVGVAAGLALSGFTVVVFSHAAFITACAYEQIKLDVCLQHLPVKVVGLGPGLDYAPLGPSHHSTDDIALMRGLPNMMVLSPADAVAARGFVDKMLAYPGPCYIRLERYSETILYKEGEQDWERGYEILRSGPGETFIATGNLVSLALQRAPWGSRVIDLYRLKPCPELPLAPGERITTLEEHSIVGGIGSLVAEQLAEGGGLRRLALPDEFCLAHGARECLQRRAGLWMLERTSS